jgi:hypothetical protein
MTDDSAERMDLRRGVNDRGLPDRLQSAGCVRRSRAKTTDIAWIVPRMVYRTGKSSLIFGKFSLGSVQPNARSELDLPENQT